MHEQLDLFDVEKDYRIKTLRQSILFQIHSDPLWRFSIKSLIQCEKDFKVDGRKALKIQEEILSIEAEKHDKMVREQYTKG